MSGPVNSMVRQARRWSLSQRYLRLLVGLGPVVALLADGLTGRTTPAWVVLVVVVLSVASARSPDSASSTFAALAVVGWWGSGLHDDVPASVLLAAAALLVSHVAAVLASYGPGSSTLDPIVLRRWLLRGCVLLAPAGGVWLVDRALHGTTGPSLLWPAALLACAVTAVVASVALGAGRDVG